MVLSSHLAPGFIRLTYSGLVLPHHMIIPIQFVGTPVPGVDPDLEQQGATTITFSSAIDAYVSTALVTQFPSTVKFGLADIYKVDATTGVRTFIFSHNVNQVGSNVGTQVPNTQAIWMFKTAVGKLLKVTLMESVYAADSRNVGSVPADARQDVLDYILSPDDIVIGRFDAFPIAFMSFVSKENDVLRRRTGFSDV